MVVRFADSRESADAAHDNSHNSDMSGESVEIMLGDNGDEDKYIVTAPVVGADDEHDDDGWTASSLPTNRKKQSQKSGHRRINNNNHDKKQPVREVTDDEGDSSDEEANDPFDEEPELTWRSPKELSLADWTIEIVVKGSNAPSQKYYVHKSTLAVGPKRSNFFASLFRQLALDQEADEAKQKFIMNQNMQKHNQKQQTSRQLLANRPRFCDFVQDSLVAPRAEAGRDPFLDTPNSTNKLDQEKNTTKLELEQVAAENLPFLLDFLYNPNNEVNLNTYNASALHYLSGMLQMKMLRRRVKAFWHEDLNMDNLITYYQHATLFKDSKILAHAEEHCAEHIFEIPEAAVVEILTAIDPQFFLRIVAICSELQAKELGEISVKQGRDNDDNVNLLDMGEGKSVSKEEDGNDECDDEDDDEDKPVRLSLLIAVYSGIHKNELNSIMFNRLTCKDHIPELECKAAKFLLELENEIYDSAALMTPLKTRAIGVLAKTWEESCFTLAPRSQEHRTESDAQRNDPANPNSMQHIAQGNTDGGDDIQLDLPYLEGEALRNFVGEVLLQARRTNQKLSDDLNLLYKWKTEFEAATLMEDFLRGDLKETREELDGIRFIHAEEIQALKSEMEQQVRSLRRENQELRLRHEREIQLLREQSQLELQALGQQYEQDSVDLRNELSSFRTKTLKLTSDISECRREQALKRDKLKLAKLAIGGPSSVLKPNDSSLSRRSDIPANRESDSSTEKKNNAAPEKLIGECSNEEEPNKSADCHFVVRNRREKVAEEKKEGEAKQPVVIPKRTERGRPERKSSRTRQRLVARRIETVTKERKEKEAKHALARKRGHTGEELQVLIDNDQQSVATNELDHGTKEEIASHLNKNGNVVAPLQTHMGIGNQQEDFMARQGDTVRDEQNKSTESHTLHVPTQIDIKKPTHGAHMDHGPRQTDDVTEKPHQNVKEEPSSPGLQGKLEADRVTTIPAVQKPTDHVPEPGEAQHDFEGNSSSLGSPECVDNTITDVQTEADAVPENQPADAGDEKSSPDGHHSCCTETN